ncbi:MAG: Unknown protein [uncultured Campylobacterales bacterium]|uniref:Uncharacterized protein n=1 Tax=uncultured Campylobacterales bacterium TaxID=352960 RepID=A0A6S6TBC2_9BACT|nr:MAG: Unknown protein [uncultured Campylobacterales bacterium]
MEHDILYVTGKLDSRIRVNDYGITYYRGLLNEKKYRGTYDKIFNKKPKIDNSINSL